MGATDFRRIHKVRARADGVRAGTGADHVDSLRAVRQEQSAGLTALHIGQ